jgi:hypothetical protein
MARSAESIRQLMDVQQAAETSLSVLNNPSQTSVFNLEKDVIAEVTNLHEQTWDELQSVLEAEIASAAPASPLWIQDQVFKFQYDLSNPQVLQLINFAPAYPTVDESLRIITRCSVNTDLNKLVKIKIARSEPPVPINALQYASLTGYLNNILPAGITFNLVNLASDKLYVEAEVFYQGEYTATIQANVEAAINNYLATIPFNGKISVSAVEDAIQGVAGVSDVRIDIIKARQDSTAFASATTIFSSVSSAVGVNARYWDTISGVITEETTGGETFADKIVYTVTS